MHLTTLFIAALSTALASGSPLTRRSDYTDCLQICSGDYSECLNALGSGQVNVEGVIFEW